MSVTTNRFRLKFMFWLDVNKADEYELAETIEVLKRERSFARTIRDGIWLMVSLRQRRTDVLFALFPWLTQELPQYAQPVVAVPQDQLQDQLKRLEQLILETGIQPTPKFSSSRFNDDMSAPALEIKKSSNTDAAANFLASLAALGQ